MATFEFVNIFSFQQRLRSIAKDIRQRANEAIEEEATIIAQRSRDEFVPVRSGKLRDSIQTVKGGIAQGRDIRGRFTSEAEIEISIIAGGDDIQYAAAIHEFPSIHNPPSWEGKGNLNFIVGGPKFLERPLLEAESGMVQRLASKLKL